MDGKLLSPCNVLTDNFNGGISLPKVTQQQQQRIKPALMQKVPKEPG